MQDILNAEQEQLRIAVKVGPGRLLKMAEHHHHQPEAPRSPRYLQLGQLLVHV
ncbi:hypothetical protein D3C76_169870 [compost metagenome]